MDFDYQQIINLIGEYLKIAMPIAILFEVSNKGVNLFLGLAFGKEKIDL